MIDISRMVDSFCRDDPILSWIIDFALPFYLDSIWISHHPVIASIAPLEGVLQAELSFLNNDIL